MHSIGSPVTINVNGAGGGAAEESYRKIIDQYKTFFDQD